MKTVLTIITPQQKHYLAIIPIIFLNKIHNPLQRIQLKNIFLIEAVCKNNKTRFKIMSKHNHPFTIV